jgi:cytochrome P450
LADGCPITFSDPETRKCPFPAYHTLRREHPVYKDPVSGNYILTRYEDVRAAVLNTKTLSNKTGVVQTRVSSVSEQVDRIFRETGWVPIDTLVTNDPPSHGTYRVLVDKAFAPARVAALEPQIQATVDSLIDDLIEMPEVDFFAEFAMKLPMIVFTDILGVTDRDLPQIQILVGCRSGEQQPCAGPGARTRDRPDRDRIPALYGEECGARARRAGRHLAELAGVCGGR